MGSDTGLDSYQASPLLLFSKLHLLSWASRTGFWQLGAVMEPLRLLALAIMLAALPLLPALLQPPLPALLVLPPSTTSFSDKMHYNAAATTPLALQVPVQGYSVSQSGLLSLV